MKIILHVRGFQKERGVKRIFAWSRVLTYSFLLGILKKRAFIIINNFSQEGGVNFVEQSPRRNREDY